MKKLLLPLFVFASTFLQGALPPLFESLNEFKSLLSEPELIEHLETAEAIVSVSKNDDIFVIETNRKTLNVRIEYIPIKNAGPAQFKFIFE